VLGWDITLNRQRSLTSDVVDGDPVPDLDILQEFEIDIEKVMIAVQKKR